MCPHKPEAKPPPDQTGQELAASISGSSCIVFSVLNPNCKFVSMCRIGDADLVLVLARSCIPHPSLSGIRRHVGHTHRNQTLTQWHYTRTAYYLAMPCQMALANTHVQPCEKWGSWFRKENKRCKGPKACIVREEMASGLPGPAGQSLRALKRRKITRARYWRYPAVRRRSHCWCWQSTRNEAMHEERMPYYCQATVVAAPRSLYSVRRRCCLPSAQRPAPPERSLSPSAVQRQRSACPVHTATQAREHALLVWGWTAASRVCMYSSGLA
jgi:hypothetical protein